MSRSRLLQQDWLPKNHISCKKLIETMLVQSFKHAMSIMINTPTKDSFLCFPTQPQPTMALVTDIPLTIDVIPTPPWSWLTKSCIDLSSFNIACDQDESQVLISNPSLCSNNHATHGVRHVDHGFLSMLGRSSNYLKGTLTRAWTWNLRGEMFGLITRLLGIFSL